MSDETDVGSARPDADENERLARLGAAIDQKRGHIQPESKAGPRPQGWGQAVRVSSDFVAGILVGAGIGFLTDHFAGTGPWGLIIFLLLGFIAGVLNVMRTLGMVKEAAWLRGYRVGGSEKKED